MTDITNQYFRKLLKEFNNSPYLGYKKKQFHSEPTESYFLLIKQVYKKNKIKKHVRLLTKGVKLEIEGTKRVNKTIGHISNKKEYGIALMNGRESKITNVMITCNKEANKT